MRQWLLAVLVLTCFSTLITGCGQQGSSSHKGNQTASLLAPQDLGPAPDFTLSDPEGNQIAFSQFQGKVVLVDFWATWCPPCREEIPGFIDLYQRYKEKGLEIVGISLDQGGSEMVKRFMQEFGVNYPVVMADGKVTRAFGGIRAIPTTFLINDQGRIVKRYLGAHSRETFEKDIITLLDKKS